MCKSLWIQKVGATNMAKVYVRMAKPHLIFKDEGTDPKTKKPYDIHLTGYDPVDGAPTCPVFHVELTPRLAHALSEGSNRNANDQSDPRLIEIRDEDEAKELLAQQDKDREERLKASPLKPMPTKTLSEETYNRLIALAAQADPTAVANLPLPAVSGQGGNTVNPLVPLKSTKEPVTPPTPGQGGKKPSTGKDKEEEEE